MNWEAVGAIAEFAGALGVIVTLLYLGRQIRHASDTAQDSAFRDIFTNVNDHFHEMVAPGNREIIFSGLINYNVLRGEEKCVFDFLITGYVNMIESSLISNESDLLAEETLEDWGYHLRTRFLPYSGMRDWWTEAQPIFREETRKWFEAQLARADLDTDFWNIKGTPNHSLERAR